MVKMKRFIAMVLCIATCLSLVPAEAFALGIDETAEPEEIVCLDHDHDHDYAEYEAEVPAAESAEPEDTEPKESAAAESEETTPASEETEPVENPDSDMPAQNAGTDEMDSVLTATCSHSYSYTYSAAGHTQHTKKGTCTKCGATTSTKENHTWSGSQCSKCGCYKPITSNGTYDVIATNGVQLYSENNSGSTKKQVVAKGTSITVAGVAAASSGYYWGKVTKIGTAAQSSSLWVCMKSSELGTHTHSNSTSYTVVDHSKHTKKTTCTKCGATSSTTETHTWSGSRCKHCGCYKPITANGTYDVIAANGIQTFSANNSDSTKKQVVPKGTSITVAAVAVTGSGYYWGKVTKIGKTTQSTSLWVCMKSSELGTHVPAYGYTYAVDGHVQHIKKGTCTKCGTCTTTATENHTWEGETCKFCGCYRPFISGGTYDVISSSVQLYSQNNSGSSKVKVVYKGDNITVTNVALAASGYYWGKVTKVGATAQTASAWVCMRSSDLRLHSHVYSMKYTQESDTQHEAASVCACGDKESKLEGHTMSGGKCSLCGKVDFYHEKGDYVTTRDTETLRLDTYLDAGSAKQVPKGTAIWISDVIINSHGNYWGKVGTIDGEVVSSAMYAYLGNLKPHTHAISTKYANVNNMEHDVTQTCSGCNYLKKTRTGHSFADGKCSQCGGWQAYSDGGDYIVINTEGVKVYPQRLSSGTGDELDVLPTGIYVRVTEVMLNSAKNYWGRVERIGNKTPAQPTYIYMGSGQVAPHTHKFEKVYTSKSDTQHEVVSLCACTFRENTVEGHAMSGGKCSNCGKAEVIHDLGTYLVTRDPETLRVDVYSDSEPAKKVAKGSYIEIVDVITNKHGNYWGLVSAINGEEVSSVMYAYLGKLKPHTHTKATKYSNVNNMEHDVTETCSSCSYTKKVRTGHTFAGGKCSDCGGWQAHSKGGDYIIINVEGVKVYSERLSSGTSVELDTLKKGTFIQVTDVALNTAKNYWGKVAVIGNAAPKQTMYIYMGSGQVAPHEHTKTIKYPVHRDQWHTEQWCCKECTYIEKTFDTNHTFEDNACKGCGHAKVPSTPGTYVPYRASEPLREEPSQDATAPDKAEKGNYLEVIDVKPNKYGNYWGLVTRVGNRKLSKPLYVYMGNVALHTHSAPPEYAGTNNKYHKKISTCICGFTETVKEGHSFENGKCTLCGALQAYSENGEYLIINSSGVWTYNQPVSTGSTKVEPLKKNSLIEVTDVDYNSADNYWGRVIMVDGKPETRTMYIYMGRGQVAPHTHKMELTYKSKSDSQHEKNETCQSCGFSVTTPTLEGHTPGSDGKCKFCHKETVSNTKGTYVTFRSLEILRLDTYEVADKAEPLSAGTCVEIDPVVTNKYGNYWGVVKTIDGVAPAKSPTYAYMGNLKPHEHVPMESYRNVDNLVHEVSRFCADCSMSKTERLAHKFDKNGVCELCTAWQAYEADGDYITVKDDVPVYSKPISTVGVSRVLDALPKNTPIHVKNVKKNSANYYWGQVTSVGEETISTEMYIYMGRGQVAPHQHKMESSYKYKSDTQHYAGSACVTCGYASAAPVVEKHDFNSAGICERCKAAEVEHSGELYVTTRDRETLRADMYSDSDDMGSHPKGTALKVTDIKTNKHGNWWGRVVEINDEAVTKTCYTYLGKLRPHAHKEKTVIESVNNKVHKTVVTCTEGCVMKKETRQGHSFDGGVCEKCNAWQPHTGNGGYVTIKAEGVPLYSKNTSDESKGSKVVKTLPEGTYIEVKNVKENSADNYWGQVSRIGNVAEKQTMYVYMGSGQLDVHGSRNHVYDAKCESINNLKHKGEKVCTICSYTLVVEEGHKFGSGAHNACEDCGAWKPNTLPGEYITVKDGVVLCSKRSSDTKDGSKPLKTLPKGTYLEVAEVKTNTAGNWWGKVTVIDNAAAGKTAMYVYMGAGSLEPHTHRLEHSLISKSNTQHTYGSRCQDCAYFKKDGAEWHQFDGTTCSVCGAEEVFHDAGSYVTVRTKESLKSARLSDSDEVRNVPAGTLLEVSDIYPNLHGNWWGKVVKISGESVGKKVMYTCLGNLESHPTHTLVPCWISESDAQHNVGSKCTKCDHVKITSVENHDFDGDDICTKCGKRLVSTETGNYVTFRESEPLRASRSKDAKSLKNVPAGTRLQISEVKENGFDNWWGRVSHIDGTAVNKKTVMYVYMGNIRRHETHDMQPFCDRKSDTQHTSGLRCTGCNLTKDTKQADHHMDSNGLCKDCRAKEVIHKNGVYLVVEAGNLKKDRARDAGDVQWAAEGACLEVVEITPNEFGNYWGKVASINGADPKRTKTYVYMGNLVFHEHKLETIFTLKDHVSHTVSKHCEECGYQLTHTTKHNPPEKGICPVCKGEIPTSTTKGDYETFRTVTLYQDKKLTKPAGITVEAGYLMRVTVDKQKDKDGDVTYVGKISQYGEAPSGNASLYVNMKDIVPHLDHYFTKEYWSRCDEYHYRSAACSLVGCIATQKGKEEHHLPTNGQCSTCKKMPVFKSDGVYRVHSGSDVELFAKNNSGSKSAGTAKAGSIIVVEGVQLNDTTGNYWGKVIWFNGEKPEKTAYVYMGSLVSYNRPATAVVSGSDQTYHYLHDGGEIFPEKHSFREGVCTVCEMAKNAPVTGMYLVKTKTSVHKKIAAIKQLYSTNDVFEQGAVLQIKEIEYYDGAWIGLVSTRNGSKMKSGCYVMLSDLTYHDRHAAQSEYWLKRNDKQHSHDINCPTCGTNKTVYENHTFNELGVCVFCEEAQPFTEKGGCFLVVKQMNVYKTEKESSAILETLPKGTVLKVDAVKEKSGYYMGSGIQILEDGKLTKHKGYIRMSRTWLSVHEHSYGAETVEKSTETGHDVVSRCTVCGLEDRYTVDHGNVACKSCGTKAVVIGEYTVQDEAATVYKDTSRKKAYAELKAGDYVKITKIVPANGVYWGLVFRIGQNDVKGNAYIPMHSLQLHSHSWKYMLSSVKENCHIYKATCHACGLMEETAESHDYHLGKCRECGAEPVPSSVGVYIAKKDLTAYKTSSGVEKKATIKKGTHLYIREIKREKAIAPTEKDYSIYGDILWGRVQEAGSKNHKGNVWVQMSGLEMDFFNTTEEYEARNVYEHTVTFRCNNCSCGLDGSVTLDHEIDRNNTCVQCGLMTIKEDAYYYTTSPSCEIYKWEDEPDSLYRAEYYGSAGLAGTGYWVYEVCLVDGEPYCSLSNNESKWIAQKDLTDHIHTAGGLYTPVDDLTHQISSWTGTTCIICGVDIPEEIVKVTESNHTLKDGSCIQCGMKEVPTAARTYYAPHDNYFAYKKRSLTAATGEVYNAGDEIEIKKEATIWGGSYWGEIKNTGEYVRMSTLSTTPVKQTPAGNTLTDKEVIDWCVKTDGATPFYSYGYSDTMLNTIGFADILLMSAASRASGLVDEIFTLIKGAAGETLAKKYYEGQVVALLTALDEEADYSLSIPHKSAIKDVIKVMQTTPNGYITYGKELIEQGKITENDLTALTKLKGGLELGKILLDGVDFNMELFSYLAMDFSRMQGIIETARAIQKETTDDPDLHRAFEAVIATYENMYYGAADQLIEAVQGDVEGFIGKKATQGVLWVIKKYTGTDLSAGVAQWSFVYKTTNFVVDLAMGISGGENYSEAMMEFMSQIGVRAAATKAYETAVQRVKDGDHSAGAVAAVRMQFAAYKVSMVELYEAMVTMASSHMIGIGEDNSLISYLQFEKNKLESITMVNDYGKFVKGISLEEYIRTH